jgi:hypothetical protein
MLSSTRPVQLFKTDHSGLTAFVIFSSNDVANQRFLIGHTTTNNRWQLGYDVGAKQGDGNFGINRGTRRGTVAPAGAVENQQFALFTTTLLAEGATPGNVRIHKNGFEIKPLIADGGGWLSAGEYYGQSALLDIGGRDYFGDRRNFGNFHQGDVAEILIYRKSLDDDERRQVEQYLTKRWLRGS